MLRAFEAYELPQAIDHVRNGGQALHLFTWFPELGVPGCFKTDIENGRQLGHLMDLDASRLDATAAALGVRRRAIQRPGTARQHIDLCGQPLERALAQAKKGE